MRSSSACERPPAFGGRVYGYARGTAGHAPWASTSRRHYSEVLITNSHTGTARHY